MSAGQQCCGSKQINRAGQRIISSVLCGGLMNSVLTWACVARFDSLWACLTAWNMDNFKFFMGML